MVDLAALERPDVRVTIQNDKDGDRGGIAQIAEESVPLKGKK